MTAPVAAPSAERLDAAVSLIVERLAPDQIILFGSGARGQMAPSSDLDLLVIKGEDGIRSTRHERWQCPDNGDQLDVVVMSRAAAERHRLSASYVAGRRARGRANGLPARRCRADRHRPHLHLERRRDGQDHTVRTGPRS